MAEDKEKIGVRTRFAPSPTGPFHIGVARTALFNWAFSRRNKGAFVLRIDDTDIYRSEKKYEGEILNSLKWLGLNWDEGPDGVGDYGPYRQSERGDIYKEYINRLLDEKKAYICYCTKEELSAQRESMLSQALPPKYNGKCRSIDASSKDREPQLIRLKIPEEAVLFKDAIRGTVKFDSSLFGDIAISRGLSGPLYNFVSAIDDATMEISHVIRGEDHISNTPKQILIGRALGFSEPIYAHLPLILSKKRAKLSKRELDKSILDYKNEGYIPEAVVNFLALLGWHPKKDREVLAYDDIAQEFDISRVQKAGAALNEEKLVWLNKEHMKKYSSEEIVELIEPFLKKLDTKSKDKEFVAKIIEAERERSATLLEIVESSRFFFSLPVYQPDILHWKDDSAEHTLSIINKIITSIKSMPENITSEEVEKVLADLCEEYGNGSVLWPLRVALSGQKASPDPFTISEILGKKEVIKRLSYAKKILSKHSQN